MKNCLNWTISNNQTKTKIRNAFANKMLMDIKVSKAQLSKIIYSGEFFDAFLDKCAGPLTKVTFISY